MPVLLGDRLVEREQPHRGGVDRHRRVHLVERDAVEERAHVADVGHRHADLADLTDGELVVGVVAGLRRQVERDRQAGLPLRQVVAVQGVGLGRRRVAGVGAHDPGAVALLRRAKGTAYRRSLGRLLAGSSTARECEAVAHSIGYGREGRHADRGREQPALPGGADHRLPRPGPAGPVHALGVRHRLRPRPKPLAPPDDEPAHAARHALPPRVRPGTAGGAVGRRHPVDHPLPGGAPGRRAGLPRGRRARAGPGRHVPGPD